jgi:LacI family transcriptional regulator
MRANNRGAPKIVALLVETSRAYGRGICRGIARYAQENPVWSIIHQERNLKQSVPKFIRRREVDGILMRVDQPYVAREIAELGIPIVDLLHEPGAGGWPSYLIEDSAVSSMAADYFVNNGFIFFAFCGYRGIPFSDRREGAFVQFLNERHFQTHVYSPPRMVDHRLEVLRAEELGFHELDALSRWLEQLPRPVQ